MIRIFWSFMKLVFKRVWRFIDERANSWNSWRELGETVRQSGKHIGEGKGDERRQAERDVETSEKEENSREEGR